MMSGSQAARPMRESIRPLLATMAKKDQLMHSGPARKPSRKRQHLEFSLMRILKQARNVLV